MEFSEFSDVIAQWCEASALPLDCWIDDANARLAEMGGGVRCSLEVLNPFEASDQQRLQAVLSQGGAGLACACDGAFAIDPDTHALVLVNWHRAPCSVDQLLASLERLANQRAALISLLHVSIREAAIIAPQPPFNALHPGV